MVTMVNKSNINAIILKDAKNIANKSKAAILSNFCHQINIDRNQNKNKTPHCFVAKIAQIGNLVYPWLTCDTITNTHHLKQQ